MSQVNLEKAVELVSGIRESISNYKGNIGAESVRNMLDDIAKQLLKEEQDLNAKVEAVVASEKASITYDPATRKFIKSS